MAMEEATAQQSIRNYVLFSESRVAADVDYRQKYILRRLFRVRDSQVIKKIYSYTGNLGFISQLM
jgi:hypothetical protein